MEISMKPEQVWPIDRRLGRFNRGARFFVAMAGALAWMCGDVRGEVPDRRWAAIGTFWGAGLRYVATERMSVESRILVGDGMAASARGTIHWDRPFRKIRPLAGLEMSVLAPFHGKGEKGQSLGLFVGGEIHIAPRVAVQLDIGPAMLRLQNPTTKKDEWEYDNVLNISVNCFF